MCDLFSVYIILLFALNHSVVCQHNTHALYNANISFSMSTSSTVSNSMVATNASNTASNATRFFPTSTIVPAQTTAVHVSIANSAMLIYGSTSIKPLLRSTEVSLKTNQISATLASRYIPNTITTGNFSQSRAIMWSFNNSMNNTPITHTPIITLNATFLSSCSNKDRWSPDYFDDASQCLSSSCTKVNLDIFDHYIKCNSWKLPVEPQIIGGNLNQLLLLRAELMMDSRSKDPVKRTYERGKRKHFIVEYGFIRKRFYLMSRPLYFPVTFKDRHDFLMLPPTLINHDIIEYEFAVFHDLYKPIYPPDYVNENTALNEALKALDDTVKRFSVSVLNSNIISFFTRQPLKRYSDIIEIRFNYRDFKRTDNHKCVRMSGNLGKGVWTNQGCNPKLIERKYIICTCEDSNGNFAVISELRAKPTANKVNKEGDIPLILVIVCSVGIFACILCMMLPHWVGCAHIGGMIRVYLYSDATQALEYIFLIIGVYSRSDIMAARSISTILHFLHHSVILWVFIEGIYIYQKVNPLYDERNGMMFFYSTIAFGITAAFTGAAAGYDFKLDDTAQYVWITVRGISIIYFIMPLIIYSLLFVILSILLGMQVKNWMGFYNDYVYTRAPYFIRRGSCFLLIAIVTFLCGLLSMVDGDVDSYNEYTFVMFLALQFISRLYMHFVFNFEVWEWKRFNQIHLIEKLAEEKEKAEKTKKKNRQSIFFTADFPTRESYDDDDSDYGNYGNDCDDNDDNYDESSLKVESPVPIADINSISSENQPFSAGDPQDTQRKEEREEEDEILRSQTSINSNDNNDPNSRTSPEVINSNDNNDTNSRETPEVIADNNMTSSTLKLSDDIAEPETEQS